MCGIGGILRFDDEPVRREALERMVQSLACRGPDDQQILIDGQIGLAHTRLAVLDAPHGRQPMSNGAIRVVYNGEIYNHRALRAELQSLGHTFASDYCDTEVLLHGYRQWVEDLPTKLRGMYAFAIWDGEELFLARDMTGKKPLFFWHDERQFVFGSTAAAVCAGAGLERKIDPRALQLYLAFGYTVGPGVQAAVNELGPKQWMRLSPRRNDQPPPAGPIEDSHVRSIDEFDRLIAEAVRIRLEADVPLGCFLSGGIDSSLVAHYAQRELAAEGRTLKTFCMAMPDAAYDESPHAQRVAEHLGADHTTLTVEPNIEQDLRFLIRTMGEPFADSSILPTYWLSKAARRHVTVALSGDGGDELFGGYERYLGLRLMQRHRWWARHLPVSLFGGEQKTRSAKRRRFIEASREKTLAQRYFALVRLFSDRHLNALGIGPLAELEQVELAPPFLCDDPADAARFWDLHHYLPGDLLRKTDRASMAVALEVRCPLLDHPLVEAAVCTPMRQLVPGRQPKQLLRVLAARYLPANICERPKSGFALPIGHDFRGTLRPWLRGMLLDGPLQTLDLNRSAIEALLNEHDSQKIDHTHRLFALLSLAIWLDN